MPRKKKELKCPRCGSRNIEVIKTWQLVAPIPDKKGRITITVMGSLQCKDCGYKWRGVVSKLKVGGTSIEVEGARGKKVLGGEEEQEERRVKEIVIDIDDLD